MVSAVVLQFERALFHLADAGAGESVAVECVDDVSRHRDDQTLLQEQDKKTLTRSNSTLGDRSTDLWSKLTDRTRRTGRLALNTIPSMPVSGPSVIRPF